MRCSGATAKVLITVLFLIGSAAGARAQQCDDFNECTANDMCSGGECMGTPATGGDCDDFNPCTINDQCVAGLGCMGEPAPTGTSCAGGCGTCEPIVPVPGAPVQCAPAPGQAGQPCDPQIGPCFTGTCQVVSIVTFCTPAVVTCPDTDGNKCTDACNFETGQCESGATPCFPVCESCDPGTGQCQPANAGAACDDFNVCTPQSRCEQISAGGPPRGICAAGVPTGPTLTPTPDEGGPTPTPTEPSTPNECSGDCDEDEETSLGEVQVAFNVFLGTAGPDACDDADDDENGEISLGEVQKSFNSFLGLCVG